jgi:octaprenyl-diphosphate synthase
MSHGLIEHSSVDENDKLYSLAAGIELIHCATLVHDDINDKSQFRRGFPSINSLYGNTVALMIGDILFVKAFELCGMFEDDIVLNTSKACSDLIEGELIQLKDKDNVGISKETILKIAELKTASLFGTGAYCGACLAQASTAEKNHLYNFGKNLGMAYQLVDDILDYTRTVEQTGKNAYQDIKEGKITLPLFFILSDSSTDERREIFEKLRIIPSDERNSLLQNLFAQTNAINKTYDEVHNFCGLAKKYIQPFDNKNLELLIDDLSNRKY